MGCLSVWMGGVLCVGVVGWIKLAVWMPHVGPCVLDRSDTFCERCLNVPNSVLASFHNVEHFLNAKSLG